MLQKHLQHSRFGTERHPVWHRTAGTQPDRVQRHSNLVIVVGQFADAHGHVLEILPVGTQGDQHIDEAARLLARQCVAGLYRRGVGRRSRQVRTQQAQRSTRGEMGLDGFKRHAIGLGHIAP